MKERPWFQIRTYLGLSLVVVLVVYVAFLTPLNFEVLVEQRFLLNSDTSIPVYAALLVAFLAGALPPAFLLFIQALRRELENRRARRRSREIGSLEQRFRRSTDFRVDGQWKKAAAELEVLLTEKPEDFATLLRYGEVLRHQGKTEQALDVHRRASVLYPQSVALLYELAEGYQAIGDTETRREIHNRILRDFPGHGLQVSRRRRDTAMAMGDWNEALRWHDKVAAMLKETGDDEALEREAGTYLGLTYQRGVALLEKERPEDAGQIFRHLLTQEPRFVPAGIMLGEAELMLDNETAALEQWQRGFKETGSPVFLKRIEDYFIEIEAPARAIEGLRSLIAQADNDLMLRFFLGRLYYRLEMHDEALKVLESIGERMDAAPIYHYLLGRIRHRRNDQKGAMARYLTCLQRLGVSNSIFICHNCDTRTPEWLDRCDVCGTWNSVDLDIQEEQLTAEEVGLIDRPVWGGYDVVDPPGGDPDIADLATQPTATRRSQNASEPSSNDP